MCLQTRVACFFLVVLCLGAPAAHALQANEVKPYVFINSASELGTGSGTNYGLVRFSEIARNNGFKIDHGVRSSFADGTAFQGVDVMIFFDPNFTLTTEDKVALRQWVRAGGILVTGEWFDPAAMDGFLNEFGVGHKLLDNSNRHLTVPPGSPLSKPQTINSLFTRGGRSITILNSSLAEMLARFDDGSPAITRSTKNVGKGEIITVGCIRLLYDNDFGISGDISFNDNDKLVQNLFSYIKSKFETTAEEGYDLNLLKLKFKKGTTFVPGEEIKFVARIRNIGSQASEETRIAFYIERTGAAPSAKTEVASASVNALNAKKKIKIVKKTFLPDDLEPGTYEVTAVIDPDELTDDADTGNNSATAKKKIVIQ